MIHPSRKSFSTLFAGLGLGYVVGALIQPWLRKSKQSQGPKETVSPPALLPEETVDRSISGDRSYPAHDGSDLNERSGDKGVG